MSGKKRKAKQRKAENPVKRFLKTLGPGLITGASDDDPSGIATYTMAGAKLGYTTLWTALVTFPMTAVVQYICAKIGMVCGTGLARVLKKHYPRKVLYPVLFGLVVANTINAGADIGAIAAAINLLVPVPIGVLIVPIAVIIVALQVWGSYRLILSTFKWLTLTLFAYIISSFLANPRWGEVLRATIVPTIRFDTDYLTALVAILGTTISPYLFFWQASEEVEEEVSMGRKHLWQRRGATNVELKYAKLDVITGMIFCNIVFYFVILGTAATLHSTGKTHIESATDAAEALRPLAGNAASLLFSLGIIGSGFLAVPVLTGSAAYAIAESFGWKSGLDEKPGRAKQFYGAIAIATFVGMLIHFLGVNPMKALFFTAVINGFVAPPLLVIIMLISNNKAIMGKRVNNRLTNFVGWATTAIMFAAAIALVLTWGKS